MNLKVIFLLAMNPVIKQRNLKERRKINGYTEKWKRGTLMSVTTKYCQETLERQPFEETVSLTVLMAVLRTNGGPQFWL